jgi:hypothetical protein
MPDHPALENCGLDLRVWLSQPHNAARLVMREDAARSIAETLGRRRRSLPVVIGPPGTGRATLFTLLASDPGRFGLSPLAGRPAFLLDLDSIELWAASNHKHEVLQEEIHAARPCLIALRDAHRFYERRISYRKIWGYLRELIDDPDVAFGMTATAEGFDKHMAGVGEIEASAVRLEPGGLEVGAAVEALERDRVAAEAHYAVEIDTAALTRLVEVTADGAVQIGAALDLMDDVLAAARGQGRARVDLAAARALTQDALRARRGTFSGPGVRDLTALARDGLLPAPGPTPGYDALVAALREEGAIPVAVGTREETRELFERLALNLYAGRVEGWEDGAVVEVSLDGLHGDSFSAGPVADFFEKTRQGGRLLVVITDAAGTLGLKRSFPLSGRVVREALARRAPRIALMATPHDYASCLAAEAPVKERGVRIDARPEAPAAPGGADRVGELEAGLRQRLVGQREAIAVVTRRLRLTRMELDANPERPDGVFLFCGPSGVGKTLLARSLAELLYASDDAFLRLDMSEYNTRGAATRITGAPPSFVGYEDEPALLAHVRRRANSLVLLDEIEKAHPEVILLLLQLFDAGRLTDARGQEVDFSRATVVMTSNLGRELYGGAFSGRRAVGFTPDTGAGSSPRPGADAFRQSLLRSLPAEFVGRIQDIVIFDPLDRGALEAIARKSLDDLRGRVARHRRGLLIEDSAVSALVDHGHDPAVGARYVLNNLDTLVVGPMVELMFTPRWATSAAVRVRGEGGAVAVELLSRAP